MTRKVKETNYEMTIQCVNKRCFRVDCRSGETYHIIRPLWAEHADGRRWKCNCLGAQFGHECKHKRMLCKSWLFSGKTVRAGDGVECDETGQQRQLTAKNNTQPGLMPNLSGDDRRLEEELSRQHRAENMAMFRALH